VWRAVALGLLLGLWTAVAPLAQQAPADDLFSGTAVQDVWLHLNARDWDDLRARYTENTFYPCTFEWRGVQAANAGCRSRGLGSRSGTKPGILVDFDRYVSGQRFLDLESIVLDNLWQDPSMLKERAAMRLLERLGVAAPRASHARVFVGSGREFAGLYAIVEDVNEAFLRRHFGEDTGYLYEYRWIDAYHFEDLGPDLDAYAGRFEARTHRADSRFTLYGPIQDLVRAINDADPAALDASLGAHLDLSSLVAQLAGENFLSEWDGLLGYAGLSNFYLYRPAGGGAARVIPWDKDNTFTAVTTPPWDGFDANVLARKIRDNVLLRQLYLQRLLDAAALGETLEAEIAAMHEQIRGDALADPVKPVSNEEFERAVTAIRVFARQRPGVVRGYLRELGALTNSAPSRHRPAR
jgi:spore coat protein CotH